MPPETPPPRYDPKPKERVGRGGRVSTEIAMACSCRERLSFWNERQAEVRRRLSDGSLSLVPRVIDPSKFVSEVAYSLYHDYSAEVASIRCDMWFGVTVTKTINYSPREEEIVYCQCDRIEDGLAAIWLYIADKYPQEEH